MTSLMGMHFFATWAQGPCQTLMSCVRAHGLSLAFMRERN